MGIGTWKKALSVLLSVAMLLSLCVGGVSAEAGTSNAAEIGSTGYATLVEAVAAATDGQTVTVLKDCSGAGIGTFASGTPAVKNFAVDFGGHTYTCTGPAVGSTGTQSQAVHLEKGAAVTLKNGTIKTVENSGVKMLVNNYCDLTLDKMTLDGTALNAASYYYTLSNNNGNVVIKDTTIIAKDGGFAFDSCDFASYTGVTVTVEGNSVINGKIECTNPNGGDNNAKIIINGGTFSSLEALKYLALNADVTVKLAADETANAVVPAGTTVKLDLNGKTLTDTAAAYSPEKTTDDHTLATLINHGTLTVVDSTSSGKVTNKNYYCDAFYNDGTATLSGGTFTHDDHNWYAIHNHGTMTINNGVTVSDTTAATPIVNGKSQHQDSDPSSAKLTINGGTFTAEGAHTIKNGDADAELTINGGTFSNTAGDVILNRNNCKAVINGGTFSITGAPVLECEVQTGKDTGKDGLSVTGGSFTGTIAKKDASGTESKLAISGGSFSANPAAYLAEGFAATLADGKYTVDGAAASIGGKYYATLVEAVKAATSGQTVTVLKDCSGAGIGTFASGTPAVKEFAVDFGGHTYTCTGPAVGSSGTQSQAVHLEKGAAVTLKNGTIKTAENSGVKMLVNNYCDLTLDNMTLDGTALNAASYYYTLSNNNGNVVIKDTTIIAKDGGFAFDSCDFASYTGVTVTVEGNSVINGKIECTNPNGGDNNAKIIINGGSFSDLSGFAYLADSKTYTLTGLAQTDVTVPAGKTIKLDGGSILGTITARGGTVSGKYTVNGVTSYPDVIGPTGVKGAGYRTNDAVFNMTTSGIEIASGAVALSSDYGTNATPITVAKGVTFTIPVGVTFQTWGNVTNNGTINNNGTLKVMSGVFANYGTIKNLGTATGTVVNHGTITGNAITGAQDATADAVVSDAGKNVANITTPTTDTQKAAVKEAVAAVQAVGSENLVTTATTGTTGEVNVGVSADKQETLTKLDTLIQAANTNVKVSVPAGGTTIATGVKVESVTNAALSVDPAATTTTTAAVTITSTTAPAGDTAAATEIAKLQKAGTTPIPVDINLQVNGDAAQPTVPLLIKLDVTDISEPAKLRIVHQHGDSVEVIVPTVSTDNVKTYISFYAATLSTFTIVETSIENNNAFKVTFVPSTENVYGGVTYIYNVMLTRVSGSDNVGLVNINLAYADTYFGAFDFQGKPITFNENSVTSKFTGSILQADFTSCGGLPVAAGQSIMLGQVMPTVKYMPDTADGTTIDAAFTAKTLGAGAADSEKTAITNMGYSAPAGLEMDTENTSYRNLKVTLNYGDSNNTTVTYYAKYDYGYTDATTGLYTYTTEGYTAVTPVDFNGLTLTGKRLYAAAPWLDSAGTAKTVAELTSTRFTGSAVYTGNWKTEYALVNGSTGVTYVSGAADNKAAQDIDLVFTANAAPNGYKVSAVTYKIGDADATTLTADENGKYTIPGSAITGPVTVTVAYAPSLSADNITVFTTTPTEGTTIFTPYSTYSGSKTLVLFKAIEGVTSMAITGATVYKLPADAYTYQDGDNTYAYAFAALIDAHTVTDITAAGMSAFLTGNISYEGANDNLNLGYTYVNGTIGDAAVVNVQCAYDFASTQNLKWTPTEADLLAADVLTYNSTAKKYTVGRDGKVDSADVAAFLYDHAGFKMPAD